MTLETCREELHSLNEHLRSLNQGLHQHRVVLNMRELQMSRFLESRMMAVVMISADVRVGSFTGRTGVELRIGAMYMCSGIVELQVPLALSTVHELGE